MLAYFVQQCIIHYRNWGLLGLMKGCLLDKMMLLSDIGINIFCRAKETSFAWSIGKTLYAL